MKYIALSLIVVIGFFFILDAGEPKDAGLPGKSSSYHWPLDINNGFSSGFGEFRSNHFHGGIDLRTHQKTGYPVYAVSDGVIFKIRMVKRGSGRGLYLKHDDGNTSIYFHLDHFESKLENLLKRIQKSQQKKYTGNYFLKKPIRYKKGDLIAYAGETGAGFPHLHLEIRDKQYYALNPFQWLTPPSADKNFPVLRGLMLRNRGASVIDGTIKQRYIRFFKSAAGTYNLPRPLVITGNLDLVVNASDRSDVGRPAAPYRVSLLVDDELSYQLNYDRFHRDDNNQLGFVFDLFKSTSSTFYYNLFSQKGFAMGNQPKSLEDLLDQLDYGKHRFRILVEDNNKNISSGVVPFYKVRTPTFEVSDIRFKKEDNTLLLDILKLDSHPDGEIKIAVYDTRNKKISSGMLNHHHLETRKPLILKGASLDTAYLEFDFYLQGTHYYKKRYLVDQSYLDHITDIDFETFINRDEIYIKITGQAFSHRNLQLTVIQGSDSIVLKPQCSNDLPYFHFKPLNTANDIRLNFAILKEGETVVQIQKRLNLIILREGSPQSFKYQEFQASFAPRAVYEPRILKVEERNFKSDFPILSRQVSLSPYSFPFLDTVYYKFKKKLANPRQVGIFKYYPRTGKWRSRYTQYDASTATYKHRLISSGTFALMRDTFPPHIKFRKPGTKFKKRVWRLTVKIWDKGKGVNDSSIKVWLNGKRICTSYDCKCEYDPDWSTLKIEELSNLKRGQNLLKVQVKDYAGNLTVKTFRFHLR